MGPKFVDSFVGLTTTDISCGYGHVCFIVKATTPEGVAKLATFPELPAPKVVASLSTASAAAGSGPKGKETKKRGADASTEGKEGTKKKGKGK